MILRALVATWIFFQVVNVIELDFVKVSFGKQVSSEVALEDFTQNVVEDFYDSVMSNCSDDGSSQNESACATCGCSTGLVNLALPQNIECEISEDVLHEIYNLILEAFKKINFVSRSSSASKRHKMNWVIKGNDDLCDGLVDNCRNSSLLPPASSTKPKDTNEACDELLNEMKYMISNITAELDLLIELIDDPELLRIRIRQLQECVSCLQTKIDVIVKQAATEIALCYETGLGQVSTCFATQLDERTKKIKLLEEMVTSKTVNVTTSYVLAGKYVEAALTFRDLKNESLFNDMMEKLYESRQLEHILQFGRALHHNNITGRTQIYNKLVELMEKSVPIETHQIIFYSFVTRDRINYCGTLDFCFPEGLPFDYATITKYIKPKTDDVLDRWVGKIRAGDFKSYILFGSPEVTNFTGVAFHEILGELVNKTYDKNSNYLNNALNFVSALRWNNQSYTAFDNLLKQAKETGRLDDQFKIAIRMKSAMNSLNGPDGEATKVRTKFDELMKKLPGNIRALVFEETCTLQAVYNNNQYLIADSSPYYQTGNRRVLSQNTNGGNNKWKFERLERGLNNYEYRIKNGNDEYLASHIPWRYYRFSSPGFDVCCTSTPDHIEAQRRYYNWQVHFDGTSNENEISLYHVGRGAYLYAHPDGDGDRKWVVLGMSGRMSSNTKWKISCQ